MEADGGRQDATAVIAAVTGSGQESGKKLFYRASLMLTSEKRRRNKTAGIQAHSKACNTRELSVLRDMELISGELMEKDDTRGAYLQDYETFKRIYRFVARGLERTEDTAYIMLLTLDDRKDEKNLLPEEEEELMELLYQVIKHELRRGDAFTQYSSCQYLLMVLSTSGDNALKIGDRVKKSFESIIMYQYELHLCYDVYPMKAPKT